MTLMLRILLFIGAIWMAFFIVLSIRKSRIQMKDTIPWLAISLLLAVFGAFPQIPVYIAIFIGIESPANMVFLIFVSILLVYNFQIVKRVSLLEDRLITLSAELAIRTKQKEESQKNEINK